MTMLTLDALNAMPPAEFVTALNGMTTTEASSVRSRIVLTDRLSTTPV